MQQKKQHITLRPLFAGKARRSSAVAGVMMGALVVVISGCKKLIEVPVPPTETTPTTVFTSDANATSAVIGIYGDMISSKGFASGNSRSITFLGALSADELQNYSSLTAPREFYENSLNSNNSVVENQLWDEGYHYIYAANLLLEGLEKSQGVSAETKAQLKGEALFIRAFCHFYLVNLFGDIPYLEVTDYTKNITSYRQLRTTVYDHITADLVEAQSLLPDNAERVRPNKWAATAFLARVYLYAGKWEAAATQAGKVINNTSTYQLEESLDKVFLIKSNEAIFQLLSNSAGVNTWEGKNFILTRAPATGETNSSVLSSSLLNAFENGDQRRSSWVDSITVGTAGKYFFPYKYKIKSDTAISEASMVLRLAEQYLVRAEARVHLGELDGAKEDVNLIRRRAGLPGTTANNEPDLLSAIAHERQVELFTEWGHRWLDLKRTGQANKILNNEKGPGWQPMDTLYPIPQNELRLNKNLTQNQGYN
ncbi:SusD family protein [Chitinophaga rupis]|uniref:SusD family protein n=1 Tax=Chitinophaga rupis TaxID=573321 RepID=A0A1H7QIW1_9BACT|nr:RagB/SusD family nutrient uptake outer membrane protein [Chitinophaga rupis]SEL47688.1 SusD family protein [Chitinophaga rupis]